jgi:hypothetical protein
VRWNVDLCTTPIDFWHQVRATGVWVGGKREIIQKT